MQLACTVFGTENTLVALLEGEVHCPLRVLLRAARERKASLATLRVQHASFR